MRNTKRPRAKRKRVWLPEYGRDGVLRRRFVGQEVSREALNTLNEMLRLRNRIWDVQRDFEHALKATYDRMTDALFGDFDPVVNRTDLEGLRTFMCSITREGKDNEETEETKEAND